MEETVKAAILGFLLAAAVTAALIDSRPALWFGLLMGYLLAMIYDGRR